MSEPFLSELKLVSFNFAPKGWAECNGQLLPINQNQALFSLLGTTYGGNGQTNFALPNLQGRVPAHIGGGFTLGQSYGEETHTLSISELPQHSHPMRASSGNPTQNAPNNAVYADTGSVQGLNIYRSGNPAVGMSASAITNVGGSQPHLNDQPYLVLNWIIALQGIFPSQN